MTWQILLLISVISYSISILLQRVLMKDDQNDPIAYSIVYQLFTGILIGIYALFNGFIVQGFIPLIPNFILMIVLYGAGNIFVWQALKIIDVSEFTIIFASRAFWTIIGAIIFLGESLSLKQVIGIILIIFSIVLVFWKKQKFSLNRGFVFAFLGALLWGIAFTNDFLVVNSFDVLSYLTIAFILPALAIWMIFPKSTVKMKPLLERKTLWKMGLLGILYAVSTITIFLAYQIGQNATQIAPLNQVSTIIIVILSAIFLKERTDLLRKLLGAIISFIGVFLLK